MRKKMMGGGMMMKRPMYKRGGGISETQKKQSEKNKAGQKATNKKAMKVAKTISKFNPVGFGIAAAADTVKRIKKMGGGSLKPVNPQTQKGLSKLPTKVRNKMGYMQDGGAVKDKPGKNIVLGKTYHPITKNAMINNILKNFSGNKKFGSVGDLQDKHKEIKEKFFAKGVKPSEIKKLDKEFNSRLVSAKTSARKTLANRPGMKKYRKTQQKAKAIDTGSEN